MDPDANMREQVELASGIAHRDRTADEILDDAIRLAELVLALNEWRANGGFTPRPVPVNTGSTPRHGEG